MAERVRRWERRLGLPGGAAEIAISVTADPDATGPRVLALAFPGGGYTRHYYQLDRPELAGPDQAAFHAARGWVFVACDPLGGGESTPLPDSACGLADSARAADLVARTVRDRLRAGTLVDGLGPVPVAATVGIGHSLGGMLLIHTQGTLRPFDAVAVLGFSAIRTVVPGIGDDLAPHGDGEATGLSAAWSGPLSDDRAHLRHAYHWDDVHPDLVAADQSAGFPVRTAGEPPPWIARTFPPFAAICLAPGVVAAEAGRIAVPVFVGAGERDVAPAVRDEARAYPAASHLTLVEVPRCAHLHNFSPRRAVLWRALQRWGDTVPLPEPTTGEHG